MEPLVAIDNRPFSPGLSAVDCDMHIAFWVRKFGTSERGEGMGCADEVFGHRLQNGTRWPYPYHGGMDMSGVVCTCKGKCPACVDSAFTWRGGRGREGGGGRGGYRCCVLCDVPFGGVRAVKISCLREKDSWASVTMARGVRAASLVLKKDHEQFQPVGACVRARLCSLILQYVVFFLAEMK